MKAVIQEQDGIDQFNRGLLKRELKDANARIAALEAEVARLTQWLAAADVVLEASEMRNGVGMRELMEALAAYRALAKP